MGSTSNALDKGGDHFKKLYYNSDVTKRNRNGQTKSGLYSLFIPMEWNMEGFLDKHGHPVFRTPEKPVVDIHGEFVFQGVLDYWENEVESLKNDSDALNEYSNFSYNLLLEYIGKMTPWHLVCCLMLFPLPPALYLG